jgi:hypothetical protein
MTFVVCPNQDLKGYSVSHEDCWMEHQEPARDMTGQEFHDALDDREHPAP